MPNRYEREIEEILRNLETPQSKTEGGSRFGTRPRRRPEVRRVRSRRRSLPAFQFGTSEWLLVSAIVAALIAGGYAYANKEATVVTGILAIVGMICIILLVISPFVTRTTRTTRSARYEPYGKVTPLRRSRNPLSIIGTRWHLFMLKLRYRRKKGL